MLKKILPLSLSAAAANLRSFVREEEERRLFGSPPFASPALAR